LYTAAKQPDFHGIDMPTPKDKKLSINAISFIFNTCHIGTIESPLAQYLDAWHIQKFKGSYEYL